MKDQDKFLSYKHMLHSNLQFSKSLKPKGLYVLSGQTTGVYFPQTNDISEMSNSRYPTLTKSENAKPKDLVAVSFFSSQDLSILHRP